MRIEFPRETERFGANLFYSVQKVYELDAGCCDEMDSSTSGMLRCIPDEVLHTIERQMAIVVPVRGELIKLIEGVLTGIPHQCLTIVVSNSSRAPVDRFRMERRAVKQYAEITQRSIIIVHQKDPVIGQALSGAGYTSILNEEGVIQDGKAEGMMLGMLMAQLAGKKYVGFVDSDNYFPGAVYEYVRVYSAGFALSRSPYAMVRIVWHSKPKIVGKSLYFAKWGRTSVITNTFLNQLISQHTGFETEVIRTGNAGEHAMTMELAMRLSYSTGYSIEPYHFVHLLELFGGARESCYPEAMRQQVEVYQIETRNPHLHEAKDEEHIAEMIRASLQVIYHSFMCPEPLKREIEEELHRRKILEYGMSLERGTYYPPLMTVDLDAFLTAIRDQPCAAWLAPVHVPRRASVLVGHEKKNQVDNRSDAVGEAQK